MFPVTIPKPKEVRTRRRELNVRNVPALDIRGSHRAHMMYSVGDVQEILDVPPRKISYWIHLGLLVADIQATGKGSRRMFRRQNLVQIAVIDALIKCGVVPSEILRVLHVLTRKGYWAKLAMKLKNRENEPRGLLICDGQNVQIKQEVQLKEFQGRHLMLSYIDLLYLERMVIEAIKKWETNQFGG